MVVAILVICPKMAVITVLKSESREPIAVGVAERTGIDVYKRQEYSHSESKPEHELEQTNYKTHKNTT